MADSKITALTSISTSTDPAVDPLVIVDVSDTSMAATGTTKKVTLNNLLSSSPTATGAFSVTGLVTAGSATITGDLTVDTSTLKVDSANNRVIVGHTSGSAAFQVTNAGAAGLEIQPTGFSSAPLIQSYNRSGSAYTQLTLDASTIVHALSGTTAMTLNANGLGIGVTPSAWNSNYNGLDIGQNGCIAGRVGSSNTIDIISNGFRNSAGNYVYKLATSNTACRYQLDGSTGSHIWYSGAAGTAGNTIAGFSTALMTLDASGNLILQSPSSPPTLGTNGQLTVNATSNTNLRFSYRGSDGTTRVANITLA